MAGRGNFERKDDSAQYTPNQIEAVLGACGVDIAGETTNDFLCFCPYHGNRYSPSFSVSRKSGTYICFNHSCGATGTIVELIKKTTGRNEFEARRMLLKKKSETQEAFTNQLQKALEPTPMFTEFSQSKIDEMVKNFWDTPEAIEYMRGRGFEDETLRTYKIGFSAAKNIIAVPMHDPKGIPVGVIGRPASSEDKFFKNSKNLPTSKTLWNFHRAKRAGDTVIITEASFDAMRVAQAGYPNVVACLGGNFSPYHFEQLDRTFSTIVIMTDFDKTEKHIYKGCRKCKAAGSNMCMGHNPGRDLGQTIAAGLNRKRILWAAYDRELVYPHDAKDAGDLTGDEIRICLKNAVSNFEYQSWNVY